MYYAVSMVQATNEWMKTAKTTYIEVYNSLLLRENKTQS